MTSHTKGHTVMTLDELQVWEDDARVALSGKYNPGEVKIIMDWFRYMKGSDEYELMGEAAVEGILTATRAMGESWSLYNSLMARLFIYAPLILKEEAQRQSEKEHELSAGSQT
jgi:hypothetical protein